MDREDMDFAPKQFQKIDTALRSDLRESLSRTERQLVELTECLQKEREYVTVFDVEALLESVDTKQELIDQMEGERTERREILAELWASTEYREAPMPEQIPALLRQVSDDLPSSLGKELREAASRLDALMDVVQELNTVNHSLVSRSLRWIEAYLGELAGTTSTGAYTSEGRFAGPELATLGGRS